jgi:hypothetical protein
VPEYASGLVASLERPRLGVNNAEAIAEVTLAAGVYQATDFWLYLDKDRGPPDHRSDSE